jgi:hypothetical protein
VSGAGTRVKVSALAAALAAIAGACTPDVGGNPSTPAAMEFDLTAVPPRVPQPTGLIINPQTGLIDFGQAGIPIPDDCAAQTFMTQAQCEFDQWLETLNGFPSLSSASAPASAELDPATLTLGTNVVAVAAKAGAPLTDLAVAFDTTSMSVTLTPAGPLTLGEFYWMGVRGYANGVRDAGGGEVVGSPTMALLKQDMPLTCGAPDPSSVDPHCPGFEVVVQGSPSVAVAEQEVFLLEGIRTAYIAGHGFDVMALAGLPKDEIAVLWGFPIHTNSVPLLVPGTAATPHVPAANQIVVGVQGPVDPATVSAFVVQQQNGPVVVMDLAAAAAGDLSAGFPPVAATYVPSLGAIVIQAATAFPAGHPIGLFFTHDIHSPDGAPLVASPVSVLLTMQGSLVDSAGHSTVSVLGDANAAALESGRQALAPLLDNPIFTPLTGVSRANLIYAYAFVPMVMP